MSSTEYMDAGRAVARAIAASQQQKPQQSTVSARIVQAGPGGTYALLDGADEPTPVDVGMSVGEGDSVSVRIENGRAVVTDNLTRPATDDRLAGEAAILAQSASDAATAAETVANEAMEIAEATGQHFWDDDDGAHVTDVTREEWEEAVDDGFSDLSDSKPYHNALWNSLGMLFRRALYNLVSISRSAIAFFDGTGNQAANITARFGADGAQIGRDGDSHIEMDFHSLQLVDKDGNAYFHVSDLRGSGASTIAVTESFEGDGTRVNFMLSVGSCDNVTVKVDGSTVNPHMYSVRSEIYYIGSWLVQIPSVLFETAPASGAAISISYTTTDFPKAYTLGSRASGNVGLSSYAEGIGNVASSAYTHAEGYRSTASGMGSHAEGASVASGWFSHAQNNGTVAASGAQTALGKYNVSDANSTYAVIVGNGTTPSNRSNALTVDWQGNVECGEVNGVDMADVVVDSDLAAVATSGSYNDLSDKPSLVTGVKGASESTYRTGNVNVTPANIGAIKAKETGNTQQLARPTGLRGLEDVTLQSLVSTTRANRLAFLPADQIIIEKTTDGGATWVDAGFSDTYKRALFAEYRLNHQIPTIDGQRNLLCGLRITITAMKYNVPANTPETEKYAYWSKDYVVSTERYCQLKDIYFWVSTANDTIGVKVECATGANPNNWATKFDDTSFYMTGWAGCDYIRFPVGIFGGSTTQTSHPWNYRFTFMTKGVNGTDTMATTSLSAIQSIIEIRGYGDSIWTPANSYMQNDHLYSFDYQQNATFPANLSATKFIGPLQGNADTATTATDIASSNRETVANYLINALPTETAALTDSEYFAVRQVGSTTNWRRRSLAALWNYIKGKIGGGFTVAGEVVHDAAHSVFASSNVDIASPPSVATAGDSRIRLKDSADNIVAQLYQVHESDGRVGLRMRSERAVNGTTYANSVTLYMSPTGERSVDLGYGKQGWLDALGLTPKQYNVKSLITQTSAQAANFTIDNAWLEVSGYTAQLAVAFKVATALTANTQYIIGTLDSSIRPSMRANAGVSERRAFATISSGDLYMRPEAAFSASTTTQYFYNSTYILGSLYTG